MDHDRFRPRLFQFVIYRSSYHSGLELFGALGAVIPFRSCGLERNQFIYFCVFPRLLCPVGHVIFPLTTVGQVIFPLTTVAEPSRA
jgi:hypothetical protein